MNEQELILKPIAHIQTEFPEKFGIPRQSGLVRQLQGQIIFEPAYRKEAAVRELKDFSHIWLLWGFSEVERQEWSPTVRPPRLGGNTRVGVFASRSPYRPNPIGLSCVALERLDLHTPQGPVLHVLGADLMAGTPIYDIKPYLPFTDSHPEAVGGFATPYVRYSLQVEIDPALRARIPNQRWAALEAVLSQDPRPAYHDDPARLYAFEFADMRVTFRVEAGVLTVQDITAKA